MLGINYPKEHAINHKIISAFDIPTYKMAPHFEEAFKFIDDALKNGNILVHCAAGISRVKVIRLIQQPLFFSFGEKRKNGVHTGHALRRNRRNIICPNYGFQNELKRLEMQLKKNR